jgi:hypothetical protein
MTNHEHPHPYQPDPTQLLTHQAYYQLIHTLFSLLPPPLADTPEALIARNNAAIAKIAALAPVNDDEADIAAHCVAARAQAEDMLRLIRFHAGDTPLVMKLTAQYALMERTAGSIRTQLQRLQAARHKREKDSDPAEADEWARHIAARLIQRALDQGPVPAVPTAPPAEPALDAEPPAPPVPPPAAPATQPSQAQVPPAASPPPTPGRAQAAAPSRCNRPRHASETDEPPRDLAAEADYFAIVHPRRARAIRQCGGLPPDCTFGPPDDDLLHAIVTGTSPVLLALDGAAAAA